MRSSTFIPAIRYARDDRTKKEVDAHDVVERGRSRAYSCPTCGARVHHKRGIGLSPYPIFAHNAHEGSKDCENYFPGFVGFASPQSPVVVKARSKPEVEDTPDELGLCLEDVESWMLYLRFPEVSAAELRNTSPRSLIGAFVQVDFAGERKSMPLVDLRSGTGSARLVVPPVTAPYKVSTAGTWPGAVQERRWQSRCRAVNPRGTLFRLRHGEWARLKEGSAVEFGEELRLVAEQRNAPPPECRASGSCQEF